MTTHQQKRNTTLLLLSLLFLVLLSFIYWMETDKGATSSLEANQVDSIIIQREGHEAIRLVKQADQWYVHDTTMVAANQQRVLPLLGLTQLYNSGYNKLEVDLAGAGLTNPLASISLNDMHIALGNPDISGERRYAMIGDSVTFVPAWVWSLIHGGVNAFANEPIAQQQ